MHTKLAWSDICLWIIRRTSDFVQLFRLVNGTQREKKCKGVWCTVEMNVTWKKVLISILA